jgi:hypothetical protein
MGLAELVETARHKSNFPDLAAYIEFCRRYLEFAENGLQAEIVSQNENQYRFFQYREEGHYNITRPLNAQLLYRMAEADVLRDDFLNVLHSARDIAMDNQAQRMLMTRSIYTLQQCIGATLDALPASASNTARKVNGDLFERLIQLLIREAGVSCSTATVQVPVYMENELQFRMSFQHDLLLYNANELKVIGSVKTSSKDRIDKIFLDKFLYCKLTETALPHIAIFLNDVQRKPGKSDNEYAVNTTFLSGHFKGFTVKLNPLDGVYYCDIRPNMRIDRLLKQHIFTIDRFFCSDLWKFLEQEGTPLSQVAVVQEEQP